MAEADKLSAGGTLNPEYPILTPRPCGCRWNFLAAAETGLTLQLLPMLAGFFTYKLAVLGRQGLAVYQELYGSQGRALGLNLTPLPPLPGRSSTELSHQLHLRH